MYFSHTPSIYQPTILIHYQHTTNDSNTRYQVESVQQVVERVSSLVVALEARYSNKHIVLTSHADTLQIMQTYLAGGFINTHPLNYCL